MNKDRRFLKVKLNFWTITSLLVFFLLSLILSPFSLRVSAQDYPSAIPSPTPWYQGMITSLPSPNPKSKDDFLVLPYYQKLKNGELTPYQEVLLSWALNTPLLSTQAKLNLFNLISALPIPNMHNSQANPVWFSVILMLWQVVVLVLMAIAAVALIVLYKIGRKSLSYVLQRLKVIEDLAFLELSFPHDTTKSAYATGEFFQLLHARSRSRTLTEVLTGQRRRYGLEIVSSRDFGIRYVLAVPQNEVTSVYHSLLSFIPGLKINQVKDYLTHELPGLIPDKANNFSVIKDVLLKLVQGAIVKLKLWVQFLLKQLKSTQTRPNLSCYISILLKSRRKSKPKSKLKSNSKLKIKSTSSSYALSLGLTRQSDSLSTRQTNPYFSEVIEFKLSGHFALPLKNQKTLDEHDPIAFLTGSMANLDKGELISFQVIASPVLSSINKQVLKEIRKLQTAISKRERISPILFPGLLKQLKSHLVFNLIYYPFIGSINAVWFCFLLAISVPLIVLDSKTGFETAPVNTFYKSTKSSAPATLDPYEERLHNIVMEKLHAHLFETTIRMLVVSLDPYALSHRVDSLIASMGLFTSEHQSLRVKTSFPRTFLNYLSYLPFASNKVNQLTQQLNIRKLRQFKDRRLSQGLISQNELASPILSASEAADLYHFPYTDTTKTAGLLKIKSRDLPAPTSIKRSTAKLDVIVGKNLYGSEETPIGISLGQRQRHTYVIGKTGMGKTEMLKNLIYQDMINGKGLAVLDPHGDLFHELLGLVPKDRLQDVIVFDPADKDYPVGLNILSSGIKFADQEAGSDKIVSSTLSVLQKVTDDKYWGPRLEHILRNTTQTVLLSPAPSFWEVQKLLTSGKDYQKQVAGNLTDPVLKQFWNNEFALFHKNQQAEVVSPITNKLGKFITSHMSRNILLQPKSTFNIQQVMDSGKILLVNLSKGELGEDQSHFFGSLIISLIQLAAYERIHLPESQRRDFFLYVDEFQNFATHIFEELSSEGRKWHVPLISSHQNIAQIKDPNLLKIVAGNADTLIALKSGPDDEHFILPFMEPEVEKGAIVNLPPYHFYMKVTNKDSEDAFSGETELLDIESSEQRAKEVVEYSRAHYATPRKEVDKYLAKLMGKENLTKQQDPETRPIIPTPKASKTTDKKSIKRGRKSLV